MRIFAKWLQQKEGWNPLSLVLYEVGGLQTGMLSMNKSVSPMPSSRTLSWESGDNSGWISGSLRRYWCCRDFGTWTGIPRGCRCYVWEQIFRQPLRIVWLWNKGNRLILNCQIWWQWGHKCLNTVVCFKIKLCNTSGPPMPDGYVGVKTRLCLLGDQGGFVGPLTACWGENAWAWQEPR